jgi:hypothetical protein
MILIDISYLQRLAKDPNYYWMKSLDPLRRPPQQVRSCCPSDPVDHTADVVNHPSFNVDIKDLRNRLMQPSIVVIGNVRIT